MKIKRPNLQKYLLNWINTHEGWHKKVNLYLVGDEIEFSPESTGRALRLLVSPKDGSEPRIKVDYYDGRWAKNLAKYSALGTVEKKPLPTFIEKNGQMVVVFK